MGLIKLSTGKFVVLSTVAISPEVKKELDQLTENGTLIESVLATHPFHTAHFGAFHRMYPHAKYYGTPRHYRILKSIPWVGDMSKLETLSMYESEGIFMRIPGGSEFVNPKDDNRFSSVFVYHQGSKTLYDDDTIMCYENPGCFLRSFGITAGHIDFHPVPWKDNFSPEPDAPILFRDFMKQMLEDWDFDNLVTAHTGIMIGGAKKALQESFEREISVIESIAEERVSALKVQG